MKIILFDVGTLVGNGEVMKCSNNFTLECLQVYAKCLLYLI